MKTNSKTKVGLIIFPLGALLFLISYFWNNATQAENLKSGYDDVNVLAGLLLVPGIIFIVLGLAVLLNACLAPAFRKK